MNIILAGATGLIGTKLVKKIKQNNFSPIILTTRRSLVNNKDTFYWNPQEGYVDTQPFGGKYLIINLSGASIFEKRWTPARRKLLFDSRIDGTRLLRKSISDKNDKPLALINASAIGIYAECLGKIVENSTKGESFIANICTHWEKEALEFEQLGIPVTIARIGNVLDNAGGFLAELAKPIKAGFGAVLGPGDQIISWIHIDDLVDFIFEAATGDKYRGIYNLVAPETVRMDTLTHKTARQLNKKIRLPRVPFIALYLLLGKRAGLICDSQDVSCEKLQSEGFTFQFPTIDKALQNLLHE